MEWRIAAESLPQLFERAAAELTSRLLSPEDIGQALREQVVVEAADSTALLVAWMNTLLRMVSEQRMVFNHFEVSISPAASAHSSALRAILIGELLDPHRHVFHVDPKRLTCSSAELTSLNAAFEAHLVFSSK
jgi:SHS2 domain-containing protein